MSKIDKAKKKVAAAKAKIAAKAKKTKKTARALIALFALATVVTGCATADPSSRSTAGKYGDVKVCVEIDQREATSNVVNVTVPVTLGDAAIASADSSGSNETQTATPTNTIDVRPKTDVNTTDGRSAGVLESMANELGALLTTPSEKEAAEKCAACTD